jgi:cytochrome P450
MTAATSGAGTAAPAGTPAALRTLDELPRPRGWPLLGNLLQVRPDRLHLQLEAWCAQFGPLYTVRLGRRRVLVVGAHEAVAAILRDRPETFRRTARLQEIGMEMGLLPGLFAAEGEAWRRQRRMVMQAFDPAHIKRYYPSLQQVVGRLARRWDRAAHEGRAIELQGDLMRYTVDTIAGLAFGSEVDTLQSEGDVIQRHLDMIFPALFRRLVSAPTWRLVKSAADRRLERSVAEVVAAVHGFVAEGRARLDADPARRAQPQNLLEAMIVAADEPGSGIDGSQVAGNVLTMLLAGEDTPANTIAWMIHLLWQNPAALAKAREEVRRTCADAAKAGFEELAALDYVEACAHETMRLKPVAPIIGAQALRDTVVAGVRVPAGTSVINLMRRDSVADAHVPQAAAFEPERWLAGSAMPGASSAKRISMPFGAGPRICPGRYLALLEIKAAMALLLGRYDIEGVDTPDGLPPRELMKFTLTPVGLRLRLRGGDA